MEMCCFCQLRHCLHWTFQMPGMTSAVRLVVSCVHDLLACFFRDKVRQTGTTASECYHEDRYNILSGKDTLEAAYFSLWVPLSLPIYIPIAVLQQNSRADGRFRKFHGVLNSARLDISRMDVQGYLFLLWRCAVVQCSVHFILILARAVFVYYLFFYWKRRFYVPRLKALPCTLWTWHS